MASKLNGNLLLYGSRFATACFTYRCHLERRKGGATSGGERSFSCLPQSWIASVQNWRRLLHWFVLVKAGRIIICCFFLKATHTSTYPFTMTGKEKVKQDKLHSKRIIIIQNHCSLFLKQVSDWGRERPANIPICLTRTQINIPILLRFLSRLKEKSFTTNILPGLEQLSY